LANLVVRNLDPRIVDALKQRASAHRRSAEAEHRLILEQVLLQPRRRGLAEVLAAMPAVGLDSDFERVDEGVPAGHVSD
jgi:plasmid stability protein